MNKTLVAIASAFLVTCTSAFAQTAAASDPARTAAVKQMLAATHAREVMTATLQQVEQEVPSRMRYASAARINADPALNDQQKSEALIKLDDSLREARAQLHAVLADPTLVDDMMAEMVPMYADTYTLDEIHQLTAFYASPLGQKMLAKTPELLSRSMQAANKIMMPRVTQVMGQYWPAVSAAGK